MKSFYKFLIFTITIVVSIYSCAIDDDVSIEPSLTFCLSCVDGIVDLDTIFLSSESLGFIPYAGTENLIFKNEAGDEVVFEPLFGPVNQSIFSREFEVDCDEGGQNTYEFNRQQFAVSHKCEALNLQYYLNVLVFNSNEYPRFVDVFILNFHEPALDNLIDTVISLNVITDFKGNEVLLETEFEFYNDYEFVSEIELLDKTFTNVYQAIEPEDNLLTELYFNKANGIVGFKDLQMELWVFDRIE